MSDITNNFFINNLNSNKIGIYISNLNNNSGKTLKEIQNILENFCKDNNLCIEHVYIDYKERSKLNLLRNDLTDKIIDLVITFDIIAFGSNYGEIEHFINDSILDNNAKYIAINNKFEISNKNFKFQFPILKQLYSQYEIENKKIIQKRIVFTPPFGYKRDENNPKHFIIEEESFNIIIKIYEYITDGWSLQQIVDDFNSRNALTINQHKQKYNGIYNNDNILNDSSYWTPLDIKNIVSDKRYVGNDGTNFESYNGVKYESIINEESFCDIQESLQYIVEDYEYWFNNLEASVNNTIPYGYKLTSDDPQRLVLDSNTSFIVKHIFYKIVDDYTPYEIAEHLNRAGVPSISQYKLSIGAKISKPSYKWSKEDVLSIVNNKIYTCQKNENNLFLLNGINIKIIEPLIDKFLFDIVQIILNNNKSNDSRNNENCHMDSNEFIYGYIKDPYNSNNFIIDNEAAKIVKYIFYSKVNGNTNKEIVDNLNLRGIPTISKYKKNKKFSFSLKDYKNWTENDIKLIINNTLYLGSKSKINHINKRVSIFKEVEPLIDEVIFKIIHPEYQNYEMDLMPSKNNDDYILDKYYIPFGYTVDFSSIKILIKKIKEAGIIKDIFNYKIKGKTSQQISDLLNSSQIFFTYRYLINTGLNYKLYEKKSIWFVNIVDNILTNEIYKGIPLKSDIDYNFFKSSEAIIDDDIFNIVIKEIENETIKNKENFENNNNPEVKIVNKFDKHNTYDKDKYDNEIMEETSFDLDKAIFQLEEDFQKISIIDDKEKLNEYHKILNETIYSNTEIENKNECSLGNGKDDRAEFISKKSNNNNNEINIFNSMENERNNRIQSNPMNNNNNSEINISDSCEILVDDNSTINEINMAKILNSYETLSNNNSTTIDEVNTPNITSSCETLVNDNFIINEINTSNMANSYKTLVNDNSTIDEINTSNMVNSYKILVNDNSTINEMNNVINDSKNEKIIKWDSIDENKSKSLDNYNNLNTIIVKNISQDKLKLNDINQCHSDKNKIVSLCHISNIISNSIINDNIYRNKDINNEIYNECNKQNDKSNVKSNLICDNNSNTDNSTKEKQIITDKELLNCNEFSYEDNKDSYRLYHHTDPPPYGYKYVDNSNNKLIIDEEAASIVKEIFQKSFQGCSKQNIVDNLNSRGVLSISLYRKKKGLDINSRVRAKKWNINSINNILSDITYIGHTRMNNNKNNEKLKKKYSFDKNEGNDYCQEKDSDQNNNTIEYNTHEAIIKEDIFNAANSTKSRKLRFGVIAPYGYKYDYNNPQKLVIQEETASIVKLIFQWTTLGETFTHIVKKLNIRKAITLTADKINKGGKAGCSKNRWNELHISTILHDETYMGHTMGEEIIYNTHEPIISEDKFNEAHYILEKRKRDNRIAICNSYQYKFSSPLPPYGYTYFNNGLIINEESAKIVKSIFLDIISGKSIKSIANQLNDNNVMTISQYHNYYCCKYNKKWDYWGLSTIKNILTDLTYLGHTTFYRERKIKPHSSSSKVNKNEKILCIGKRNTHKAIIDEKTFNLAQIYINN